jgi:arylsulfatase A-like enzyme
MSHRARIRLILRSPNVLLITLGTFRADRIGAGTPALAGLARRGVSFAAASSPVPLTLRAHASLLSGLFPLHHGLRNNGIGAFPLSRATLTTTLARAGYRTGAFVGSFILDHRFALDRGFERYDDAITREGGDASGTLEAERRGSDVAARALDWLRQRDPRAYAATPARASSACPAALHKRSATEALLAPMQPPFGTKTLAL